MTFEEKFEGCMKNFQNQSSPGYTRNDLYLYADFIELIALFSKDGVVSVGDILDRFYGTIEYSSPEAKDEDEIFIKKIFELLKERSELYNTYYPYLFDDNEVLLSTKPNISEHNKLYIYLLISSKLNIFNDFTKELTTEFEYISKEVLEKFLPNNAIVKNFGRNTAYTGNARNKIKQLAADLNLTVDDYEIQQIAERNNQERGLDIVGWIPFEDNCMNILVFLAQCACGKNYEVKQHDARRFRNYLNFYKLEPILIMFISYSLISLRDKKFYHSDLVEKDYLIFERKRIIELYGFSNFSAMNSYKIINECIAYKESLV
ncbi:hypothetical protein [Emticicia soli]|uniref:Uncharacterized protein n=1 Tax=Emticicia soli TaxID=2027878 RepID=A0ABW5JER1_9BACT